jgi:hypothetical protein
MICRDCRQAAARGKPHDLANCPGGSWCDCQHAQGTALT